MQNPFGSAFSNAGLQLPDPNAPKPQKILSPEESEAAAIAALQSGSHPGISIGTGGAVGAAPGVQDRAIANLTTPPPVPLQDAAAAQVGPAAPVPVPAAAAPARRAAGPGLPFGSQTAEHIGALSDANEADQAAVRAQATGASMRADLLDEQRDAADQRLVERNARRAAREQQLDQHMADLDARIQDASSQSYDSGKFFAQPGTMLMNIGAALGGGAAARVTGRNDAQAVLERGLDRDFQAWKANAEQKQSGVREKSNLVTQMRAAYGDRDQADLAAEIVHKEMAANAIEAQAARSKVPEIQAQGAKLAAGLREGIAALKDKARATAAAQIAAAEARRRADEKEQFERGLKVAELGIKKSEAESKRLEAEGKGGKDINAQTGKVAAELTSAGIPTAEATALRARESVRKGGTVINMNPVANTLAQHFPLVFKIAMGDEAAAAQQDFAAFQNAGKKMLSGVSVSESERPGLEQQFENAKTPEDRVRAINNTLEAIERQKATIMAGVSPEAAAEYKRRFEGAAPITTTEKPRGFTPGVK